MKGGRRSTSWKQGQSGNRSGRPKRPATIEAQRIIADVKEAAKTLTAKAIATLERVMDDPKAPPAARVGAATAVLDRGWGRPTQPIEEKDRPFSLADLVAMSMEHREAKARALAEGQLIEVVAARPQSKE
jgi:hypothetical protein